MKKRWAVFLSGRGSNFEALLESVHEEEIVLSVSSKKSAPALVKAKRAGIPSLVLEKQVNWEALSAELKNRRINAIFLLGFMKILPESFVNSWPERIWNLHPSLLPAFPGKNSIEESFKARGNMGVTVHEVTAELDAGPIKLQFEIEKKNNLSEAQLEISRSEQRLVREFARRVS
jgi:phosphoribosylglycinamide formyltransferase-1